jgi:hypothetical protein
MNISETSEGDSLIIACGRALFTAAACSLVLCLAVGVAEAHGGGPGLDYDPCLRQTGADDFIHMAVYQPEFNPFAEYCAALPKAGHTLLVFDLIGADLPGASVALDVSDKRGQLRLSVPPQRYRSGIADLQADLPAGRYTVLVSIDELDGRHRLSFPLTVGARWSRLAVPVSIALLLVLVTTGYCVFQVRTMASERGNALKKNPIELRRARL